jgi:hypothetical protein
MSPTARDHVKGLFEKVNVRTRGELIARIFWRHAHDSLAAKLGHAGTPWGDQTPTDQTPTDTCRAISSVTRLRSSVQRIGGTGTMSSRQGEHR